MLIEEVGKGIWISILQLRIRNSILFHGALRGGQAQRSVFQPISIVFPISAFFNQRWTFDIGINSVLRLTAVGRWLVPRICLHPISRSEACLRRAGGVYFNLSPLYFPVLFQKIKSLIFFINKNLNYIY